MIINLRITIILISGFLGYTHGDFSCPSWFGLFDDSNDLTGGGFYFCAFGYNIHGSCNDSLAFYPKKCVGWTPKKMLATLVTTSRPIPNFDCPWIDGNYPDITDVTCKGYWNCFSQNATYMTCNLNKNFDTIQGVCSEDATCDGYSHKCDEQFSYTADPDDRTKYWECYFGMPYHWTCDPGLEFDAENHYCNLPM